MNKLALVACNTYAGKEYCLDEWVAAYNALTYEPKANFVVDNTAVSRAYLQTLQDKGLNAVHYQPFLDKPFAHTFHRGFELFYEEAVRQDAFWIFSVEADNIPAPESLEMMVRIAEYGSIHLVTHDYALHQSAAAASGMKGDEFWYCEFGCMLMSRELLGSALDHYDEYESMAPAVFNTNYHRRGGHCRLMQSFEVGHLDGFEMEYEQGFADPLMSTTAITPTPFLPQGSSAELPPSLRASAQIVKLEDERAVKLDLGSGGGQIPGYVSVDFNEDAHPHVVADVEALPFEDDSVDVIYASHVLEHVKLASPALAEWHRVLKPGGVCTIATPDIVGVYKMHKEGGQWGRGWPIDLNYVNATAFGANLLAEADPQFAVYGGPGHEHKQIFIDDMLEERMRAAGFEDVRRVAQCEVRPAVDGETMVQGRKPAQAKEQ